MSPPPAPSSSTRSASPRRRRALIPVADAFEGLAALPVAQVASLPAQRFHLVGQVRDRTHDGDADDDQRGQGHDEGSLDRTRFGCQIGSRQNPCPSCPISPTSNPCCAPPWWAAGSPRRASAIPPSCG